MARQLDDIEKLKGIATDAALSSGLRVKAIENLGDMGSHQAFLALLEIAASQEMIREERDLALRVCRDMLKQGN